MIGFGLCPVYFRIILYDRILLQLLVNHRILELFGNSYFPKVCLKFWKLNFKNFSRPTSSNIITSQRFSSINSAGWVEFLWLKDIEVSLCSRISLTTPESAKTTLKQPSKKTKYRPKEPYFSSCKNKKKKKTKNRRWRRFNGPTYNSTLLTNIVNLKLILLWQFLHGKNHYSFWHVAYFALPYHSLLFSHQNKRQRRDRK